jgi:hypothetical protein
MGHALKVLIISANTLPMSPVGPAYIAGAALVAGPAEKTAKKTGLFQDAWYISPELGRVW